MEPATRTLTAELVDRALEAEFQGEHFELEVRRYTQFSLALSSAVFLAYGLHDALVLGEARADAWLIRYAVFTPVAILVLLVARSKAYARWHQPTMLLFGMTLNLVVLWIGALAPDAPHGAGFFIYTSYAILFVTLGPFIAKMSVVTQAIYTALSALLFLGLAAGVSHPSAPVTVSITATLFSLGAIGALAARQEQSQARRMFLARRTIRAQMKELDDERAKSEALLLNILPSSVAARLKSDERAIADGFAEVTVLFADIVGFTKLSERLTPQQLVRGLNEMFSAFDDLAGELGVEKIKTIGDAYMAVSGLHGDADHARTIAELGLGMLERVAAFGERFGGPLSIRIGISTGPAVAGVIGKRKFIYDVWGDTVNTASRMESHGVAGTIHVTASTHALLAKAYDLEPRGDIEVKGKGLMPTWLLRGRRAS